MIEKNLIHNERIDTASPPPDGDPDIANKMPAEFSEDNTMKETEMEFFPTPREEGLQLHKKYKKPLRTSDGRIVVECHRGTDGVIRLNGSLCTT